MSRRLGLAADLRPEAPGDQVEGLELGVVPALGLPARAAGGGIVVDGDQRLAVDEAGARVDVAELVHRGDGGAGELDLELEAAAAGEGVEVGGVAAGPGEEGDLVDRAPEGDGVGRLAVVRGRRRGRRRRSGRRRRGTRCRGRRASRSGAGPRSTCVPVASAAASIGVQLEKSKAPGRGSIRCQRRPSRMVRRPRPASWR